MNNLQNIIAKQGSHHISIENNVLNFIRSEHVNDISDDSKNIIISNINKAIAHLNNSDQYITNADAEFKDLYASGQCFVLAEGLEYALGMLPKSETTTIVLYDNDLPIHWVLKLKYQDHTYYADAYGLFKNLDDIIKRYSDYTVTGIQEIVHSEDDYEELETPTGQRTRDLVAEFLDDFEEILENAGLPIECLGDTVDFYERFITLEASKVFA